MQCSFPIQATNLYFDVIYSFNERRPFDYNDYIHQLHGNLCNDLPCATKKKRDRKNILCFLNEATLLNYLYYGLGLVRSMHVYK